MGSATFAGATERCIEYLREVFDSGSVQSLFRPQQGQTTIQEKAPTA